MKFNFLIGIIFVWYTYNIKQFHESSQFFWILSFDRSSTTIQCTSSIYTSSIHNMHCEQSGWGKHHRICICSSNIEGLGNLWVLTYCTICTLNSILVYFSRANWKDLNKSYTLTRHQKSGGWSWRESCHNCALQWKLVSNLHQSKI